MPFIPPENYFRPPELGGSQFRWGSGILPEQNRPEPPQQGPFGADLPRDLQSMIAPYRDMASKFSSPYLMMNKDSWLAQKHPGAANIIDNALSAVALSKFGAPASAGQNLSAALGGALEATQMKRQQLMQQAMLPYHMLQPQLAAEHTMAQTEEERTRAQENLDVGAYHRGLLNLRSQEKSTGAIHTDDDGYDWQEVSGPGQPPRLYNMGTKQYMDELLPEQRPTFLKSQKAAAAHLGISQGEAVAALLAGDPRAANAYASMAAGKTSAERGVTQPLEDQEKFRDEQVRQRTTDIPPVPSRREFEQERNAGLSNEDLAYQYPDSKLAKDRRPSETASDYRERKYQESIAPMQQEKERHQQEISQYQASPAWKHGVSFQDWKQNPDAWKTAPTAKAKPVKSTPKEYKYDAQGNRIP